VTIPQLGRPQLGLVHAGHGFTLAWELNLEKTKSAARFFPRRADA
jgi:hypothetical protein